MAAAPEQPPPGRPKAVAHPLGGLPRSGGGASEECLRVFFALWPPAAVAGALHRVAGAIAQQVGGRPMARDTLHQTLAFIGEVSAARVAALQELAAGLSACPGCTLVLDRLGYWRHNHIVWAAPSASPAELGLLAGRLGQALEGAGFPVEKRPFQPHLTLLRKVRNPPELPLLAPQAWPVEDFVLVASELTPEGSRYRVLERWPLAGG
jgi:2'-5' RNA ligase